MTAATSIDQGKLEAIVGQAVTDFGATISAALVVIGDQLGLYKTLAGSEPMSVDELARRTGTNEHYVYPWLVNQAASGYVTYCTETDRYTLTPEQAVAMTDETSPFYVGGGFEVMTSAIKAAPRITDAFKSGDGLAWGEHDHGLFEGTERFFRPGYEANLIQSWIPALDGLSEKLEAGATVVDIGCGHGASTLIMAKAFPRSRFFGYDFHAASIERARELANQEGLGDRVLFDVADAAEYPGGSYDLVTYFDCLHDLGDPIGAMRQTWRALKPNGHVLIVEPMAGENVAGNLNPVGRIFSGASVLICTPNALATGGNGLGTIATDQALGDVARAAGFTQFRRATATPFNRIFEARK
ncbi:MAG: class I SAM-dependent methyltransferase [Thermomicrobiales bacterium]